MIIVQSRHIAYLSIHTPQTHFLFEHLAGLVQTKGDDVRVNHRQVEWSKVQIRIRKRDEHSPVHGRVALEHFTGRLEGITFVLTCDGERCVGEVELRDPGDKSRAAGIGISHIGVIGSDRLARGFPGQVDELAREGKRLGAVVRNAGTAAIPSGVDVYARLVLGNCGVAGVSDAVADDLIRLGIVGREAVGVCLVHEVKRREVLPCQAGRILGARADVGCEISPGPRLGNASLKPDRHRVEAEHLAEGYLLASFRGNGLREELGDLAAVQVVDEAPNTRLSPAGKLLVEIYELANSREWVVVRALGRGSLAQHVAEEGGVARLLDGHEGDIRAILSSKTLSKEIFLREDGETVVEQIELNPFLVQTKLDRLEIEVAIYHVARLGAIGTKAT